MEISLSKLKINSILSIGALIAIIVVVDAALRIYLNWLQIREIKAKENEKFYPKVVTDAIENTVTNAGGKIISFTNQKK